MRAELVLVSAVLRRVRAGAEEAVCLTVPLDGRDEAEPLRLLFEVVLLLSAVLGVAVGLLRLLLLLRISFLLR